MTIPTLGASPKSIRYVSGIRPTGHIHLGNYLGAIRQWKKLQAEADCVFFVADLHGVHSKDEVLLTLDTLQRCGISPVRVQSEFNRKHLRLLTCPLQDVAPILTLGADSFEGGRSGSSTGRTLSPGRLIGCGWRNCPKARQYET